MNSRVMDFVDDGFLSSTDLESMELLKKHIIDRDEISLTEDEDVLTPATQSLSLRVAGIDFDLKKALESLDVILNTHQDMWTSYPNICASNDIGLCTKNDLIVHASMFNVEDEYSLGLRSRSVSFRSRASMTKKESADLITNIWLKATDMDKQGAYISPSLFMIAAIKYIDADALEDGSKGYRIADNYLELDNNDLNSHAVNVIKLVLHLLRELYFLSLLSNPQKPANTVSIKGRLVTELKAPIPYTASDPKLDLGQQFDDDIRYLGLNEPMHTMILGASGTGKTYSQVIPNLKAHLNYRLDDGTVGAALVVDPKKELSNITKDWLKENDQLYRYFLAGVTGRIRLFPKNSSLSLFDRIELLLEATSMNRNVKGDSAAWIQKSISFLQKLVLAHATYFNHTGRDLYIDLLSLVGREISKNYWMNVASVVKVIQEGEDNIKWVNEKLRLIASYLNLSPTEKSGFELLARFASMKDEGANQISYVTGGLDSALVMFTDESIVSWVDISPVPEASMDDEDTFEISSLIEDSKVIVFQPGSSPSHDVFTKLLKAQFFRSAMERENLRQPILFLCDEFQRFVTNDRESGEASFLDRCRAYRVTAVLATQSIAALYDALSNQGNGINPQYAVSSILPNIARMFYFQTLDIGSKDLLKNMIPVCVPDGWIHPVDILPLSSLNVGEAYYILPNGKWGRTQIKLAA